ncbi:MAG: SDR family NAD(P)-dependent oxidoreductase, partial [Acidobacteriales bacterium]
MKIELSGKTALVTGASRGIGSATAAVLARMGVSRFVLHYGGYREGAEKTLAKVRELGADGEIVQADLGALPGIQSFLAWLGQSGLKADILINNAGSLVGRASLLEFSEELYDRVMNLNVKSLWFITQAVAPAMVEKGSGVIVNLSSIAGRNGGGPG